MVHKHKKTRIFYGTTTLGEKGQVVIPAEAREALAIKKGEKLLVFGMGHDMLAFSKVSNLKRLVSSLTERLENLRKIVGKNRK